MEPLIAGLTLVDLVVVAGVGLVLPASLGGNWRAWWLAAVTVAGSCLADRGSFVAVLLPLAWPALVTVLAIGHLRTAGPLAYWQRGDVVGLVAWSYALVASVWMLLSRAGAAPLGIQEPIVQLTAVHFTYAGVAALVLAATALDAASAGWPARCGQAAIVLTACAPPVVAAGFVSGAAVAQVGGAVLMSAGVFATAVLHLREAAGASDRRAAQRVLLAVSGLAVWVPMGLAVAWAAAQHVDVPALSIPDMARVHGLLNAVGFVGAGLLARAVPPRCDRPPRSDAPHTEGEVPTWS